MFRLEDGKQQDGYVLTSDVNGNATWKPTSGAYTFTNGLNEASGTTKLGGTLTENTTIDATNFSLNVSTPGRTNMLYVDKDENVVKFGWNIGTLIDSGVSVNIDGASSTIEYITSNWNQKDNGTTTGVGSVEFLIDGNDIIASSHSFLPLYHDDPLITDGVKYGQKTPLIQRQI